MKSSSSTSYLNHALGGPTNPSPAGIIKQEEKSVAPDSQFDTFAYESINKVLNSIIENNAIIAKNNKIINEQNAKINQTNETIVEESKKVPLLSGFKEKADVWVIQGKYKAFIQGANPKYIFFYDIKGAMDAESKKCDEGIVLRILGLKFHISLPEDESNRAIMHKGWELVKNILIDNGLFFKILRDEYLKKIKEDDRGKLITVYANENPNISIEKWRSILEEITQKLEDNAITPGPEAKSTSEKPEGRINGSRFISYRYDDEANMYQKLLTTAKPSTKKIIGSAKIEKARLETESANKTLDLIQKKCGGVINVGEKSGWPVNDPIEQLNINITLKTQPTGFNKTDISETTHATSTSMSLSRNKNND